MSWAKVDDQLHSNEKMLECSLAARGLWLTCLSWVADKETDGMIPRSVVKLHAASQAKALSTELVSAGLWVETEGGWAFHDYLIYNPSKSDLESERQKAIERKARWKERNASGTPVERRSSAVRNAEGTLHPDPVPVPNVTNVTSSPLTPPATQGLSVHVTADDDDGKVPASTFGPKDPLPTKALAMLAPYPEWWQGHLRLALAGRAPRNLENYAMKVVREWIEGKSPPQAPLTVGVSHLPRLTPGVRASLDREINSHQFMNDLEATLREEGLV